MKSDNANGLFGFDGPCTPSILNADSNEALQYTCSVVRSRGDEGIVTVPWEVRNVATGSVATGDYVNASGEVIFPNGVRTQVKNVCCLHMKSFKAISHEAIYSQPFPGNLNSIHIWVLSYFSLELELELELELIRNRTHWMFLFNWNGKCYTRSRVAPN